MPYRKKFLPKRRPYVRRKRVVFRHRRSFRRRGSALLQNIRYFKQKLTGVIEVKSQEEGTSFLDVVFSRCDYKGIIANVIGINTPYRWAQVRKNYEQYAVTGFKMKYMPTNHVGTVIITNPSQAPAVATDVGVVRHVWTYEDIDSYNIANYTNDQIVALESFKSHSCTGPVKLYRSNAAICRQQKVGWEDTAQNELTANKLPKSSVCLRLGINNFPPGSTLGWIKYSYYVTFKGQARNQ